MRRVDNLQPDLGQIPIAEIVINPKSRDDIPKVLRGLQYIYCTPEVHEEVFAVLKGIVPKDTDASNGRPGMTLWRILVLGTVRTAINADYDRLHELADNHLQIRQMMNIGTYDEAKFNLQTIKDNVQLLTPEMLEKINNIVVASGHKLVKKKDSEGLRARVDSFVVTTDVHYPTDSNLLWDAMRKIINLSHTLCVHVGNTAFRQAKYNLKQVKRRFHKVRRVHYSTSRDPRKREIKQQEAHRVYREYLMICEEYVQRAEYLVEEYSSAGVAETALSGEISRFTNHAKRQIDQIQRRIFDGEKIPHGEKVFSLFQEHTEWICKGKAGVPQELGVRAAVVEDQYRFILHHRVMYRETDEKVTVALVERTKALYPEVRSCSFDKGFYAPQHQGRLEELIDLVVLPKKGRRSQADQVREGDCEFQQERRRHSGVESAIHGLVAQGLGRCLDHGKHGLNRYVALSVVSRNLHTLGNLLLQREQVHQKTAG